VRAKQSFTALGMYSSSGPFTSLLPINLAGPSPSTGVALLEETITPHDLVTHSVFRPPWPVPASVQGEGLLHDARNLMGTLGPYCDLLSLPDVLKPEHRQSADDLRLVGTRSGALIEHLIEHLTQSRAERRADVPGNVAASNMADAASSAMAPPLASEVKHVESIRWPAKPVSLRSIVERCSGLLSRVAHGQTLQVSYGEAAAVPVGVAAEAVERILVNLVRNSAAALGKIVTTGGRAGWAVGSPVPETAADSVLDENPAAIRIGVGLLANQVGNPKPWPFRWVRLTVEDSGRGMDPEKLEQLLCDSASPSRSGHGIGFRVVTDLVRASNGDLRVMSTPGAGTRIQIEWPVAGVFTAAQTSGSTGSHAGVERCVSC
jgi:signal transduction histidine kinase